MRLHERFCAFCEQYPDTENLDKLAKSFVLPSGTQVGDYLFAGRTIVCEIKTLVTETSEKLATFMSEHGIDPANLADGEHEIKELFLALDDGEAKYKKAITLATTPITDGLDEAENQIRDTKELFGLPDADGLVVILNDQVNLASPPLVHQRLGQRLAKNGTDGTPYHANIRHIVYVCETWVTEVDNKFMHLSLGNPRVPERQGVARFMEEFMTRWAEFNDHTSEAAGRKHRDALTESKFVVAVGRASTEP